MMLGLDTARKRAARARSGGGRVAFGRAGRQEHAARRPGRYVPPLFSVRPRGTIQRSSRSNPHCDERAPAAPPGSRPARISSGCRSWMPVRIGSPRPPAPISAASVAVPTLMTALVLMPARIAGEASGSSTAQEPRAGGSPSASRRLEQRRRERGEPDVRVAHDRQQAVEEQRDERRRRADARAAGSGTRAARARESSAAARSPRAPARRVQARAAATTPSGTPTSDRGSSEIATSRRCWQRVARDARAARSVRRVARSPPRRPSVSREQRLRGALGERPLLLEHDARVGADHPRLVDRARPAAASPRAPRARAARGRAGRAAPRRSAGRSRDRRRAPRRPSCAICASVV